MRIAFADESGLPVADAPLAANTPAQGTGLPVELLSVAPVAVLQLRQALRRVMALHLHAAAQGVGGARRHT